MRRPAAFHMACAASALICITLAAHPTPFSNAAVDVSSRDTRVTVVAYAYDFAMELGQVESQTIEPDIAGAHNERIAALVRQRLSLELDGRSATATSVEVTLASDRKTATITLQYGVGALERMRITSRLFPYDPLHESFVTVRAGGRLAGEAILTANEPSAVVTLGTPQSRMDVVRRFVKSGVSHIAIGPDHVLFIIGLLLLGGRVWQLVTIVTAFTLAHSVTLSLAVLDVASPPPSVVEPAIAATICIVAMYNLTRATDESGRARVAFAFVFGLIHGFGFAAVLREMDLPRASLGWSLFAFNLGVEIGQVAIVIVVAGALAWAARRSPGLRRRIGAAGSLVVLWAGAYWLVQRLFFS